MLSDASKLVKYNPETGEFTAIDDERRLATAHNAGYLRIRIGKIDVLAHRLAWFITHGSAPEYIDHINRVKSDNRISNLRPATHSQNLCNRGVQSNSTSGVAGVARDTHGKKWQAYIKIKGKRKHLGVFDDFADAVAARKAAEPLYMGDFAPK